MPSRGATSKVKCSWLAEVLKEAKPGGVDRLTAWRGPEPQLPHSFPSLSKPLVLSIHKKKMVHWFCSFYSLEEDLPRGIAARWPQLLVRARMSPRVVVMPRESPDCFGSHQPGLGIETFEPRELSSVSGSVSSLPSTRFTQRSQIAPSLLP